MDGSRAIFLTPYHLVEHFEDNVKLCVPINQFAWTMWPLFRWFNLKFSCSRRVTFNGPVLLESCHLHSVAIHKVQRFIPVFKCWSFVLNLTKLPLILRTQVIGHWISATTCEWVIAECNINWRALTYSRHVIL